MIAPMPELSRFIIKKEFLFSLGGTFLTEDPAPPEMAAGRFVILLSLKCFGCFANKKEG